VIDMGVKACKKGEVKAIDGKCYPGYKTKTWTIVDSVGDLRIYRGVPSLKNYRGAILEKEGNWQPPSIQISKDNMKHMEESNTAIFFDTNDLKKKKWKNTDIKKAR